MFGAGSIGAPIAARLVNAGESVQLYVGNPEIATAIERDGIAVTGISGNFSARPKVSIAPAPGDGPFDIALLAMKTDRLRAGVQSALPLLAPDGFVVCLQNGVPEPAAMEIAGPNRVVGGVVSFGGSMEGPGRVRLTSRGRTVFGEPSGPASPRVERLSAIFTRAGLPATTTSNLAGVRWSKLAINCTISTLGGVSGLLLGQMLALRDFRQIAFTVMSEVADVARAAGVRMEKVAGTFDIDTFYVPRGGDSSRLRAITRDTIFHLIGFKYRRMKSGVTRSLERGRMPEIDALNGYVAARAKELAVPVPMNDALTRMVHEIVEGERKPAPEVRYELRPFLR